MKTEEILQHLGDLKTKAEGHFTNDGDDEIFHQDAEALQAAIDAVKRNEIIADAINSEIANCNREIRKVDIEKAVKNNVSGRITDRFYHRYNGNCGYCVCDGCGRYTREAWQMVEFLRKLHYSRMRCMRRML